ncbi:MAG: YdcF family protein [Candidatus Margulisiibacteriota bacterium]
MRKPTPKHLAIGAGIILAVVILYVAHPFLLEKAGRFLIKETLTLRPADVAIVLAGDEGERVAAGIQLQKQGIVPLLLMSGGRLYGTSYAEEMAKYAASLGASPPILVETQSRSTYENATLTLPIVQAKGYRRVIIVTSKFHTRRTGQIFKSLYPKNIDIQIYGAPDLIDYTCWWTDHEMTQSILTEWAKTWVYWLKY